MQHSNLIEESPYTIINTASQPRCIIFIPHWNTTFQTAQSLNLFRNLSKQRTVSYILHDLSTHRNILLNLKTAFHRARGKRIFHLNPPIIILSRNSLRAPAEKDGQAYRKKSRRVKTPRTIFPSVPWNDRLIPRFHEMNIIRARKVNGVHWRSLR